MNLNDAELARRIEGGDREAEAELCRRMGPRIRLYGLKHLRDAAAADDLMQNVLITMLETLRAGKLREVEKVASFVLGTCRMTVVGQRRGVQRRDRLMERWGLEALTPATAAGPQLDGEALGRCMQQLAERERAVMTMSFYDEQSGAEIAGYMGISEANVRVIRHRAIHALRGCMGVAR
jgi:RNA polymerase sigma-70 factor (ECF subfamily)